MERKQAGMIQAVEYRSIMGLERSGINESRAIKRCGQWDRYDGRYENSSHQKCKRKDGRIQNRKRAA